MSFDIYLQRFRYGLTAPFPRAIAVEVLGRNATALPSPLRRVDYPDGGGADIYCADADEIAGLTFNHCGGTMFFAALFELAQRTGSVIYWPDLDPSIAVTDASIVEHFPGDGFDRMGPAYIARDHEALAAYISRPASSPTR